MTKFNKSIWNYFNIYCNLYISVLFKINCEVNNKHTTTGTSLHEGLTRISFVSTSSTILNLWITLFNSLPAQENNGNCSNTKLKMPKFGHHWSFLLRTGISLSSWRLLNLNSYKMLDFCLVFDVIFFENRSSLWCLTPRRNIVLYTYIYIL